MAQNEKDEGDNKLSAEREQPNDETKQGNGTVDFRTRYAARLPDHLHDCHDCGAKPGEIHQDGCDTEVCSVCGLQRLQCLWIGSCRGHDKAFARWTGLWPGIAEAFVKTFKRDYARLSILPDAETVIALLPAWFEDYNEVHPHSGLKFLSPREFLRLSA